MPSTSETHTLGKIILIQSTLHLFQDNKALLRFVCRGFSDLPWINSIGIFLPERYETEAESDFPEASDCRKLLAALKETAGETETRDGFVSAFEKQHAVKCLTIKTSFDLYGFLLIRPSDENEFQKFQPYLENSTNLIALMTENAEQNTIIRHHQEKLELLVAERTKALKESEQKYRTLFHSIRDSILVADLQRTIISCNQAFSDLFGYTLDEIQGRKTEILYAHPQQFQNIGTILRNKGHESNSFATIEYRKKNGEVFPGETNIFSFLYSEGHEVGFIGLIRDISDKIAAEEERQQFEKLLRHSQKMEAIGTLAGGIAHDFNNILYPLMGFTEMLKEDVPPDSPLHDNIDEILQASFRARDLVKQILSFSRQGEQELKPIKLQPIIKEALKLLRSTIPTTIEIHHEINPDCGIVVIDPSEIHQVIMNLVTNAYQSMEETGGSLKVGLEQVRLDPQGISRREIPPGDYALLRITDTGPGIDKGIQDKIFDPYFTTKGSGKGTGLGLSVVQGIVQRAHGMIHISSEPGQGTEVQVSLPVMQNLTAETQIDADQPVRGGTENILLVDDEAPIVKMEQQILARLGYSVSIRTGSLEALEAFKADPECFDLVVTDMTMPNMTGVQLAAELKSIRPDIPVILCTGFSYQVNEEKSKALGIDGFVMKHVVMKEIATAIRKALD